MPEIDLTVNIAVILALAAILSPILTAIINNIHDTKIKKINIQMQYIQDFSLYQRSIFENYLSAAGEYSAGRLHDAFVKYCCAYSLAYTYAPKNIRDEMEILDRFLNENPKNCSAECIERVASLIEPYLSTLSLKTPAKISLMRRQSGRNKLTEPKRR